MAPSINPNKIAENFFDFDFVLILKFPFVIKYPYISNSLLAMRHPTNDEVIIRYVIGNEQQWIKDKNINLQIYHKIPKSHFWADCLKGLDDSSSWGPVFKFNNIFDHSF